MSNLLEIRDLKVSYGGISAVKGINIDVPEGEIVTLIGANGAGKSTTLRSIAGLVKAEEGTSIKFNGEELVGLETNKIVAKPNSCKNISATLAPNRPKKLLVFSTVDTLLSEISFLL